MAEGIINEKSATEKILAIAGGIASFGSLFPYFFQNVTSFDTEEAIEKSFTWFTTLYLLLPSIAFLLWVWLSNRFQGFYTQHGNSNSQTQSQKWMKLVHLVFGIALLINCIAGWLFITYGYKCKWYTITLYLIECLLLLVVFAITLTFCLKHSASSKSFKSKLSKWLCIILLFEIAVTLFTCIKQRDKLLELDTTNNHNFTEILLVNNLKGNLETMQSQSKNISDRFYLKSKLALDDKKAELKSRLKLLKADSATFYNLVNEIKNKDFTLSIQPYISFFNALILNNDEFDTDSIRNVDSNLFSRAKLMNTYVTKSDTLRNQYKAALKENTSTTDSKKKILKKIENQSLKIDNIIKTTCNTNTNYYKKLYSKLNLDTSYDKLYANENFINPHQYILLNINEAAGNKTRTRFPYYTTINRALKKLLDHSGDKTKPENLIDTANITNALKEYFSKEIPTIKAKNGNEKKGDKTLAIELFNNKFSGASINKNNLLTLFKEYTAASINFDNSKALYDWIQDYISYCQRKTQFEIEETRENALGIWKTAQKKGVVVFVSVLFILLFYFIAITACKWILAEEREEEYMRTTESSTEEGSNYDVIIVDNHKNEEAQNKGNEKYEKLFQKVDWHLYPITTFIAIIFALLIPMFKEIKSDEIKLTEPSWMTSISNWNLNSNIKDPVKDEPPKPVECNCRHTDTTIIQTIDSKLLQQIQTNTSSINSKLDCN